MKSRIKNRLNAAAAMCIAVCSAWAGEFDSSAQFNLGEWRLPCHRDGGWEVVNNPSRPYWSDSVPESMVELGADRAEAILAIDMS